MTQEGVRAWVEWHELLGVDLEPVVPAPIAAQARSKAAVTSAATPVRTTAASAVSRKSAAATSPTAAIAAACATLDAVRDALAVQEGCALRATATQLCFADGNPAAALMLVGEAPGAEEDRVGKPFVGPSGQLLDRMLASIGLDRRSVYITNVIYWRPPGNRPPTAQEIAFCLPFLTRQIELIRPRLLVSVGGIAARALFGLDEGVTRLRGRSYRYAAEGLDEPVPALVMFHPAYLLRQPAQKKLAWQDLLAIRDAMRERGIPVGTA